MSFNKQMYDPCNARHRFKESTGAMKYQMSNTNTSDCYSNEPGFISRYVGGGVVGSYIDTESELKNMTRPLSECPSNQHQYKNTKEKNVRGECGSHLRTEYTREKRPCNVLSGVNINRFEPLCTNLQELNKIHSNCFIGANSRLETQDRARDEKDYRKLAKKAVFHVPKEFCYPGTSTNLHCNFTKDTTLKVLASNSKIFNNKSIIKKTEKSINKCKLNLE